jgi:hypothetical protein
MAYYDQANFDIRCEWGLKGLEALAPISDVIVIVDILELIERGFESDIDYAAALNVSPIAPRLRDQFYSV